MEEINHSRADCTEEQGSLLALRSRLEAGEWKGGGTGGREHGEIPEAVTESAFNQYFYQSVLTINYCIIGVTKIILV